MSPLQKRYAGVTHWAFKSVSESLGDWHTSGLSNRKVFVFALKVIVKSKSCSGCYFAQAVKALKDNLRL